MSKKYKKMPADGGGGGGGAGDRDDVGAPSAAARPPADRSPSTSDAGPASRAAAAESQAQDEGPSPSRGRLADLRRWGSWRSDEDDGGVGVGGGTGRGPAVVQSHSPPVVPAPGPAEEDLAGAGGGTAGVRSPPSSGGARPGGGLGGGSQAVPLTRTFSTPESKYRPLLDEGEGAEVGDAAASSASGASATPAAADADPGEDLGRAYPLLLQRSACSAFGRPSSSFGSGRGFAPLRSRSHGGSDPGASAFHPVWSCKSLSTSSAGSLAGSSLIDGSEVGSAVSGGGGCGPPGGPGGAMGGEGTGVAGGIGPSFLFSSARSDLPSASDPGGRRKKASPWRRVVARMKKGTGMGGGGSNEVAGRRVGGSRSGSRQRGGSRSGSRQRGGNGFRRSLGGRENPARPNLSEDESSPETERVELEQLGAAAAGLGMEQPSLAASAGRKAVAPDRKGSKGLAEVPAEGHSRKTPGSSKSENAKAKGSDLSRKKEKASGNEGQPTQVGADLDCDEEYSDPGVALDLSESDDNDDEDKDEIGPIIGNYIPLDEGQKAGPCRPPSVHLPRRPRPQEVELPRPPSIELPHPPSIDEQCPEEGEEPAGGVEVVSAVATPDFFRDRRPLDLAGEIAVVEDDEAPGGPAVVHILSSSSVDENSPPSVERVTAEGREGGRFPYHPLGVVAGGDGGGVGDVCARLKYRSPRRSSSEARAPSAGGGGGGPSALSSPASSQGSPDSRISGAASHGANTTISSSGGDRASVGSPRSAEGSLAGGADGTDSEVREANRRVGARGGSGGPGGDRGANTSQEVVASPDGNDTVFTSSTTSSNYHGYPQSPRPLREGATMPVERFFAGGNVALSPTPSLRPADAPGAAAEGAPSISRIVALSPKKLARIGASNAAAGRDGAHSPHTVSSNSVSNHSTSSGSEAQKKPLKFVAYEIQEECESPYDEHPSTSSGAGVRGSLRRDVASAAPVSASSLIKPRISKNLQRPRLPMVQRPLSQIPLPGGNKPPQSPRKQDSYVRASGARSPTRTPPPSALTGSGANTPCSPPVIADGPIGVCAGDGRGPCVPRPHVVRRSTSQGVTSGGRGWNLIPPSAAAYRPQLSLSLPPQSARGCSPLRDGLTVVGGGGADGGSQEIVFAPTTVIEGGGAPAVVGSEGQLLHRKGSMKKDPHGQGDAIPVVSPEKGF